jgi:adenine/guanine phosphoribosyltransferase-like PRPP-binding protein
MDFIDRRVDTFQIETSNQWRGLLRTMAAAAAASIAAVTASVMDPAPDAILTAAVLGFLTGGPIAWTVRDLTRWVERKAEF